MHAGGITEVKRIAALADMYYIPIAPHNPGGPICMLAAMHLAAAIPNFFILEQMEEERALRDQICTNPVHYNAGCSRCRPNQASARICGSICLRSAIFAHNRYP